VDRIDTRLYVSDFITFPHKGMTFPGFFNLADTATVAGRSIDGIDMFRNKTHRDARQPAPRSRTKRESDRDTVESDPKVQKS